MRVVVSDTSVISNLWMVGKLDLLQQLFQEIFIPLAVQAELIDLEKRSAFRLKDFPWLREKSIIDLSRLSFFTGKLDPGEAEAIILSEEMAADLIIIDEAKGRAVARSLGIPLTGLLGVLLEAKQQRLLTQIKPVMDQLRSKAGFYIDENLYLLIASRAGE
jgi:predicted nucleic acid-binding protein